MTDRQRRFDTTRAIYRRHGLRSALLYVIRKILWFVPGGESTRNFLYVLAAPRPTPEAVEAARGHTFRFATLEELTELSKDPQLQISDQNLEALKMGHRCLLQYDGDQLVGYTWASGTPLTNIVWGFHVNLPDEVVYNYKGYTAPEYRGKGLQALRHVKILEESKKAGGQQCLFGYVNHLNFDSMRGVRKSGYERIGVLTAKRRRGKYRFVLELDEKYWSVLPRA